MNIKFSQAIQPGRQGRILQSPCQDKISIAHINGVSGISLADGAGSCKFAAEGATLASERIHQYMADNFERFLNQKNKRELANFVVMDIQYALNDLANALECQISDLASTLLYAGVKKGNIIVLHLGDGWIYGFNMGNETPLLISSPQNGSSSQYTYLTTSPSVAYHLRIQVFPSSTFQTIMLCSDGFPLREHRRYLAAKIDAAHKVFSHINDAAQVLMKKAESFDDAAYVSMCMSNYQNS